MENTDPTKERKEPVEGNIIIKITIGKKITLAGKKKTLYSDWKCPGSTDFCS